MKIIVLGAGMMGKALVYDLNKYSNFENICVVDLDKEKLQYIKNTIKSSKIDIQNVDMGKTDDIKKRDSPKPQRNPQANAMRKFMIVDISIYDALPGR